jgi:DNA-binding transcriptional MerR regulator
MKETAGTLYPIRAAARLTQLSIDTLRAWEKRYGAVRPTRKNGVRMYSESDIHRLSLLRQALEQGHTIGQAHLLSGAQLESLVGGAGSRSGLEMNEPMEALMAAIDRFQYAAADRELRRLASLMSPRELIHTVALPLLRAIGEQWHEQRLHIAQEHMMSQLLTSLLGGMSRIYAPQQPPATVLTATLSDDLHGFGVLAAAILAAGAGLGAIHLGPDLPVTEVVYAARRSGADVVLLSVTFPQDRQLRQEQVRSVRTGIPREVELWVALNPASLEFDVRGVQWIKDFLDLERQLQRIGGRF